ncbi:hypothetical protein LTR27_005503 [Elasticomyces elasticus]|nr:hypothetical protein LTR27_005503 [Elasticomyces elasticus]
MPIPVLREATRTRIETAVAQWRTRPDRPPFTGVQLIVMAFLTSNTALSRKGVYAWVVSTFFYYRMVAVESFLCSTEVVGCTNTRLPAPLHFRDLLEAGYRMYDLPLGTVESDDGEGEARHTISPTMGEGWLDLRSDDHDEHIDMKHFPFFGLPRELRDKIYQMLFKFPRSGLFFSGPATKKPIVRSRDLEDDSSFGRYYPGPRNPVSHPRDLNSARYPVSAARQSLNSFNFGCQRRMSTVITRLPRAAREHVRSVGVRYDPRTTYTTNVTRGVKYDEVWFRSLEQLPGVKKLEVQFIAKDWNLVAHVTGWPDLSELRGVNVLIDIVVGLRELGEVEVCVVGCPALQEILGIAVPASESEETSGTATA